MEYVDGGMITDKQYMIDNNIDVRLVSDRLGSLYSEMIFVHGYVHCDPHPGNIFVRKTPKDTELILLDHGLYTVSAMHDSSQNLKMNSYLIPFPIF